MKTFYFSAPSLIKSYCKHCGKEHGELSDYCIPCTLTLGYTLGAYSIGHACDHGPLYMGDEHLEYRTKAQRGAQCPQRLGT